MKIYWSENPPITEAQRDLLERAVFAAVSHENKNGDILDNGDVNIDFLSAEEMRTLNRTYRGKDSETDVLSFPGMGSQQGSYGDIALCMDVAKRQAEEYGHSFERELTFLAVHGMLHLLGHDHITPEGEAMMCAAQEAIMNTIGVSR